MGFVRGMLMSNLAPIRRATAQDGAACAAIVDAWIEKTDWMPRGIQLAELAGLLSEGLPKRDAFVVGHPITGYLSMDPSENHIWGLYVSETGKGFGKRLIEKAKEGRRHVQLNTHQANTRAHAFYAREGFVQVGEAWMGDDGIPEIRMEWQA